MNGLNEFQAAELILLTLSTGIILGTFIGAIVRALQTVFYK